MLWVRTTPIDTQHTWRYARGGGGLRLADQQVNTPIVTVSSMILMENKSNGFRTDEKEKSEVGMYSKGRDAKVCIMGKKQIEQMKKIKENIII